MKKVIRLAYSPNNSVLFLKVTIEILPISSHRILKRYSLKVRALIKLIIFTPSLRAFVSETELFFFFTSPLSV